MFRAANNNFLKRAGLKKKKKRNLAKKNELYELRVQIE